MLKLLVVDDEAGIREGLALSLGDTFEVSEAADGAEALRAIAASPPDLVILDQQMSGLSGTQVLEQIHAMDHRIPVVMLSAGMDVPLARRSMHMGAQDCVVKPFDLERLKGTLNSALERRPNAGGEERPFALEVAPLMSAPAGPGDGPLPDSRTNFILELITQALVGAEGDRSVAAGHLGLEPGELDRLWQDYARERSLRDGIASTGR